MPDIVKVLWVQHKDMAAILMTDNYTYISKEHTVWEMQSNTEKDQSWKGNRLCNLTHQEFKVRRSGMVFLRKWQLSDDL
jgi:hypothetical protein